MNLLLLIIVLVVLFGGGGAWGVRQGFYGPGVYGGGLGTIVLILLVLWVLGRAVQRSFLSL